jgi:hypothetical protein
MVKPMMSGKLNGYFCPNVTYQEHKVVARTNGFNYSDHYGFPGVLVKEVVRQGKAKR